MIENIKKIKELCNGLWFKWKNRKVLKHLPKTVNVEKATEKDLENMGRLTYVHQKTREGAILVNGPILVPIRHKKSGRVIMVSASLQSIKSMYGNDYEIVDSAIKEPVGGEIEL